MVEDRTPVHSIPLGEGDWGQLEVVMERGRAWVRRNVREWPFGHDLFPKVRTDENGDDWVDFYFVPTDYGEGPLF